MLNVVIHDHGEIPGEIERILEGHCNADGKAFRRTLFVILRSPRASFRSFHRLNVGSRNLSRLMPSRLRGRPTLGRFAAVATEELLNRHRIPLDYRSESSDCPQYPV